MTATPIPVLCDCCRAQGLAGEDDFAHLRDLLDFEPVPRKKERADGWTPQVQRFFIIALVATGSDRQAARAVGKAQYGVTQLKEAAGNESFLRAHARALEIHAADNTHRLAEGVRAVTQAAASWRAPRPPAWSGAATRQAMSPPPPALPAPAAEGELTADQRESLGMLATIISRMSYKLTAEHEARMDGRIKEADFYVRQITWLEVALDLTSGDGMKAWREFRHDGRHLIDIAETQMSRLLDFFRRRHWEACGDPPRPEHPIQTLLNQHRGYATEPLEATWGGLPESHEEQQRRYDERHREAAKAQIQWEAQARRDYERRRDSDAASST
jgi:hypothetical protein